MFIRPTQAEYKQFADLKKKIEDYEKSKTEMINMCEDIFTDIKDAIASDRYVTIVKAVPSISINEQVIQLTITVGV